jgi:hypothetical protein
MSTKASRGVCVYCGSQKELTVDHVPPKVLLARPYPPDLLTVPACSECNSSFMKDDEYTRSVLTLDVRASTNADAQSNLPNVLRSLRRPDARGLTEYLISKTEKSTLLGPDGAPWSDVIEIDRKRINACGARMIRGLFFIEMRKPLSQAAVVRVAAKAGISAREPGIREFARFYSRAPVRRDRAIGNAFSYAAGFHEDISFWMMLLYDYFAWLGTVDGSLAGSREALAV